MIIERYKISVVAAKLYHDGKKHKYYEQINNLQFSGGLHQLSPINVNDKDLYNYIINTFKSLNYERNTHGRRIKKGKRTRSKRKF